MKTKVLQRNRVAGLVLVCAGFLPYVAHAKSWEATSSPDDSSRVEQPIGDRTSSVLPSANAQSLAPDAKSAEPSRTDGIAKPHLTHPAAVAGKCCGKAKNGFERAKDGVKRLGHHIKRQAHKSKEMFKGAYNKERNKKKGRRLSID
jgi:hypothetical protein